MKSLFKAFLLLVSFISTWTTAQEKPAALAENLGLIPIPQQITVLPGEGITYDQIKNIHLQEGATLPVLYDGLKDLPTVTRSGSGTLTLALSGDTDLPDSPEGYVLEIKAGQVTIKAGAEAGLFYGCQTLQQMLSDAQDQNRPIPACRITDYPDIAYRAVHLDLKHHMDSLQYYYQMMDRLARIKVNAVIVEFEDKLAYASRPEIGAGNAISKKDFTALSAYAHQRHIEISPLVQGLGHASYILKHPQYVPLREDTTSDWAFSPLDPGTYRLLFDLYQEAMEVTPYGKYLHVGGDEVGALGTSALSKQSGLDPFELQMYWLDKVCAFAEAHHRIPIFWDDMVFKLAKLYQTTYDTKMPEQEVDALWEKYRNKLDDNIQLFPKNCVYMRWNYSAPALPGNINAIDWYTSHHLSAMAATAAQTAWTMMPRNHSNFQPIKDFCRIATDKNLDGILCTVWDDSSPHYETVWRGLYFFSLFSWHYEDMSLQTAEALFRHRFYGPALSDPAHEFQDSLEQTLYYWETALLDKGSRRTTTDIDVIGLPDPEQAGQWSKKYQQKIAGAKRALAQSRTTQNRISLALKEATRNAYSLTLLNQLNNLQVYPAKLILLLNEYDQAASAEKTDKLKTVVQYVQDFDSIRQAFEKVFSETRQLQKPEGYQLDQNQGHWANTTLNSDWMFLIEMATNKVIKEWALENVVEKPAIDQKVRDL